MSEQSSEKPFVPLSLEEQMELVEECIDFERIDRLYSQYYLLINSTVRKMFKSKNVYYNDEKVDDYVVHAFVFFTNKDFVYLKKWRDKWKQKISNPNAGMTLKKLPGYLMMLTCYSTLNQLSEENELPPPPPLDVENISTEMIDIVIEKNEKIDAILKCISKLTPLQRLIFKLHYFYYIKPENIATMTHRERNAIDQCLMNGREKVKKCTNTLFNPKNQFFLKIFHKKRHQ